MTPPDGSAATTSASALVAGDHRKERVVSALPEVLETVVLGPNDRLVVVVPWDAPVTDETRAEIDATLGRLGLDDRVLFVAGAQQLAVLRGEDPARAFDIARAEFDSAVAMLTRERDDAREALGEEQRESRERLDQAHLAELNLQWLQTEVAKIADEWAGGPDRHSLMADQLRALLDGAS